jgi:hypothetical protein
MTYRYFDPLQDWMEVEVHARDKIIPHFRAEELGCQHCGMIRMAVGFPEHLVVLRRTYGQPIVLNSACRCTHHNTLSKGHPNSSHICDVPTKHDHKTEFGCCGIDVRTPSPKLVKIAIALGWSVGISRNFVHLDRVADYSTLKNYQRLFFYEEINTDRRKEWEDNYGVVHQFRARLAAMSWDAQS